MIEDLRGERGAPARFATAAWLLAVIMALALDRFLFGHGLIKMEASNASQLQYHALIRDGLVVLASPAGSFSDALHHWFFHLLLAVSPRVEVVAVVVNAVYYFGILGFYAGMRRRFGPVAGAVSSGLLLASPVSAILSKHAVSTALVPLLGAFYALGHLDFAKDGDRRSLGRCVAALAALIALNHGHLWIAPALLYEMRRRRCFRVPAWALAAAAAALSSGIIGLFWKSGGLAMWGGHYGGVGEFVRRAVLVEWRMDDLLPNLDLLFVVAAGAGYVLWRRFSRAPAGLAGLLAYAVPMIFLNREATVFWQVPLCILIGWAASQEVKLAGLALLHVLLALASYHWLFRQRAEEPNFFVLSSLRTRQRVLGALTGEMGMRAGEFETLALRTRQTDNGIPALAPGLRYLVDRVGPALAPGGDRCFSVADDDVDLPPGAVLAQEIHRYGLDFKSWRGGPPCRGNARLTLEPILGLDLRTLRLRTVRFER